MNRTCSYCGAVVDTTMRVCKQCGAPNDAFVAQGAGPSISVPTGAFGFEKTVSDFGDRLAGSMGLSRGGSPGFLELMVRGAFLDGSAYRAAASNPAGTPQAILALVLPILAGLIGSFVLGSTLSFGLMHLGSSMLIVTALIGLVASVGGVAIMAALSSAVIHKKIGFGELLRGTAYAQSPGLLALIPFLGMVAGIWRIVTTFVAIREVSGTDNSKAAILMICGVVGMIAISAILSPILIGVIGYSALSSVSSLSSF